MFHKTTKMIEAGMKWTQNRHLMWTMNLETCFIARVNALRMTSWDFPQAVNKLYFQTKGECKHNCAILKNNIPQDFISSDNINTLAKRLIMRKLSQWLGIFSWHTIASEFASKCGHDMKKHSLSSKCFVNVFLIHVADICTKRKLLVMGYGQVWLKLS